MSTGYLSLGNSHRMERDEWLALRRTGIGSSDAPAILGISPFTSALGVYVEKLGLSAPQEDNEVLKWGRLLEPLVLQEFGIETNRDVQLSGDLIQNLDRSWMLATLDGVQWKRDGIDLGVSAGIVEIKTTGYGGANWIEGVPEHVWVQIQHQLAVTNFTWASAAALINGCRSVWADVERDDKFIYETLIPAEEEFWRRVQTLEPVDPDGSQSAREALKALYPVVIEETIPLPGELMELDSERMRCLTEIGDRKKAVELIDQLIKMEMGAAAVGVLANGVEYHYKARRDGARVFRRKGTKDDE